MSPRHDPDNLHLKTRRASRRAFTLLELILALFTLALASAAICTLTFGAMNTDRYVRSATTGQSEVELAMRRIVNNLKEAQTGSIIVATSSLTTTTQSDAASGYPTGATVSYALQPDATVASQKVLVETDQRYGSNTIAHNVVTFNVAPDATIANLYQIDLVIGTNPIAERHFKVYARN